MTINDMFLYVMLSGRAEWRRWQDSVDHGKRGELCHGGISRALHLGDDGLPSARYEDIIREVYNDVRAEEQR